MSQSSDEAFPVRLKGDSMWPTYPEGTVLMFHPMAISDVEVNDVVLVHHPMKKDLLIVKRVHRIEPDGRLFLTGDQPDPLASEDSHNFGPVHLDNLIGVALKAE